MSYTTSGSVIKSVVKNLKDAEIIDAIHEIRTDEKTGVIREDGIVKNTLKKSQEILQKNPSISHVKILLFSIEFAIFREAAYRYAEIDENEEFIEEKNISKTPNIS